MTLNTEQLRALRQRIEALELDYINRSDIDAKIICDACNDDIAHVEDHMRALEYVERDTDRYFWARCEHCGWEGSSKHLREDTPHAEDTDVYCPECDSDTIEEANPQTYSKHTARLLARYPEESNAPEEGTQAN